MYREAFDITPNDTTDLDKIAQGIYVGVGGDLTVHIARDDGVTPVVVTFKNVPAGFVLPIFVKRVLTTTTATDLIGLRS